MKRIIIPLIGSTLALGSLNAMALSVSGHAGNHSHGFQANQSLLPGWTAGVGYLSTKDSGKNARAYSGQLMFSPSLPSVDLSIGGRYQYLDTHYGNGGGLGLGGSAYVNTPLSRISVGGYGFYTPDGLTHGDVNKGYEYGVQARARLVSNTYGYVGYRYVRTDFDGRGGKTLDSGPVIGVSIGF